MKKTVAPHSPTFGSRRFSTALVVAVGFVALFAQTGGQAAPPAPDGPLTYSRGFLVTGNFLVAGIRTASGDIQFSTTQLSEIPRDADIVGAFLVWETVHSALNTTFLSQATFRGQALSPQGLRQASYSLVGNTANCWGAANSLAQPTLTISRADVLHLLPKRLDTDDRWTGKYVLSGQHAVQFPDGGNGNLATQSGGGTLVIVYSHPGEPLRKVVMYDGVYAKPETTDLTHTLRGFYQSEGAASRLAHLVGVGGNNATEVLKFNGDTVATNPFTVRSGSGRTWNTVTYDLPTSMPGFFNPAQDRTYGERVTTSVAHSNRNQGECQAWGSILFSVQVKDDDHDGLPDGLEDSARLPSANSANGGVSDPDGRLLPNLYAMGARLLQRDLMAEFNYTWARGADPSATPPFPGTQYGTGATAIVDENGHHHMPSPEVLKLVGDVYKNKGNIHPHFDVGDPAAYYAQFCGTNQQCINAATAAVGAYLVPGSVARGGESIQERSCTVDLQNPTACQFPDWPGTVSYPLGVQLMRDAPVATDGSEISANDLDEWAAGEQRRRFDLVRRDYVHYLLYAHARAKPRSLDPCIDTETEEPTGYSSSGDCDPADNLDDNPQYHIPSSASGVADLPGSKGLITLGLWDPVLFTATPFVQASTTLHELGHNFYLWHGGWPVDFGDKDQNRPTVIEPNCKPNYLSSMSYMFQVHGLWTNSGQIELNYSGLQHAERDEHSLTDSHIASSSYRAAWYAPFGSELAQNQGASVPVSRFCSGAKFDPAATKPADMARVLADNTADWIDWNGDGAQNGATDQDVNFTGPTYAIDPESGTSVLETPELLRGYSDWDNIHLDQIGSARNVSFFTTSSGLDNNLTLDTGSGGELVLLVEAGSGGEFVLTVDAGSGVELGLLVDGGSGGDNVLAIDLGSGTDITLAVDAGSGTDGLLTADLGSGGDLSLVVESGSGGDNILMVDLGGGDEVLLMDAGSAQDKELTYEGALEGGRARPSQFDACIIGSGGGCPAAAPGLPLNRTYTSWKAPTFGTVAFYHVSRKRVGSDTWELLPDPTTNTFYVDTEELPEGRQFLYRVQAEFDDGVFGPYSNSNPDPITAKNVTPVANPDPNGFTLNQGTTHTFAAPAMLANDTDEDSPGAIFAVAGTFTTAQGGKVVVEASGRFTYTPPTKGFYGTDSFTYKANNGTWSRNPVSPDYQQFSMNAADSEPATVTIEVRKKGGGK